VVSGKISDLAFIEDGAVIGDNVTIEPFAYIGAKVKLGNNVTILSHAKVVGDTDIGDGSIIHPFSVIGGDPQDISYKGEDTKLVIGKNNKIRECVTINKGTLKDDGYTVLGDNNLIMATVHIAHDCKLGNNIIIANAVGVAGHVQMDDHSFVGAMTGIHQFVKIGESAMIGGASALTQDIPPFCLAEGNRAVVKSLNVTGLRRRFERNDVDELLKAYKQFFRSDKALNDVAQEFCETSKNDKVKKMAKFILDTKRGIPR
jgi:UDP-N-acetylglucosamine acyltransferase